MKILTIYIGLIFIVFSKNAQCQMQGLMQMMTSIPNMVNGMRENQARAQLTPIVRYVVGDTATPSPEMVNFAVIAGSAPVTQTEKDAYLDMMKKVARRTPEVLFKFVKNENGTYTIDELKLDAYITQRAMQYSAASNAKKERERKEKEQKRQQELEMLRLRQNHELDLIGIMSPNMNTGNAGTIGTGADAGFVGMDPGVGYDIFGAGDPLIYSGINHHVVQPVTQAPVRPPAQINMNSFSLLDVMRRSRQNSQSTTATTQVTTPTPVQTPQALPAGNPDMLNFMMLNGGMDMGLVF